MNELLVEQEEIQLLLNILGEDITISYPLSGIDILSSLPVPGGYSLKFSATEKLDEASYRFGVYKDEVPTSKDLRECLINSGIYTFSNMDEIGKKMREYRRMPKSVKFSPDTNMLYFNVVSSHRLLKTTEIVMVDTVLDEIKGKINRKYKENDIREISQLAPYRGDLFKELMNKRKKVSRTANIAQKEYNLMKGDAVSIKGTTQDDPDRAIADALEAYEREQHTDVVMLTADDAMVSLCEADNIGYIKCDLPHEITDVECDHDKFTHLIKNMASMMGLIKLGPAVVYGEYRKYTANNPDRLKVKIEDHKRYSELKKELELCRKLRSLEIEQ